VSETQALFAALRETADAATAAAIERLIKSGADRDLVRINVLAFAAARGPRRRARHRRVSAHGPCSADVLCSGVVPFEIAGIGLFPGLVAGFEKRSGLISLLLIQDDRHAGT
jgi:Family of unknown function (DUF5939)